MEKTYKYRIYPNKEQKVQMAKTFGCARFVYNIILTYGNGPMENIKSLRSVSNTQTGSRF